MVDHGIDRLIFASSSSVYGNRMDLPLREMFIVLNHTVQDFDRDGTFHSQLGELTAKFSYTFRF